MCCSEDPHKIIRHTTRKFLQLFYHLNVSFSRIVIVRTKAPAINLQRVGRTVDCWLLADISTSFTT
jgi:hypothetical protein